jgi:hypothetical protein
LTCSVCPQIQLQATQQPGHRRRHVEVTSRQGGRRGRRADRKITLSGGNVRYRVVVDAGRKPDGTRAQGTSTHRTRREAREWLAAVRTDLGRGSYVAPQRTTLDEHLDTWLEGKRDIRPATRRSYVDWMKPVRQMLDHKLLQDVAKAAVEALVTTMLTTGGRQGQGHSPRTVTMMLVVLQQAMQDAVQQGLIVRNVVSLVQKPCQVHYEMSAWTLEQTRTFLARVPSARPSVRRSRAICESSVRNRPMSAWSSSPPGRRMTPLTCGSIRADARTRTANRPITSRVRYQLRHAGVT